MTFGSEGCVPFDATYNASLKQHNPHNTLYNWIWALLFFFLSLLLAHLSVNNPKPTTLHLYSTLSIPGQVLMWTGLAVAALLLVLAVVGLCSFLQSPSAAYQLDSPYTRAKRHEVFQRPMSLQERQRGDTLRTANELGSSTGGAGGSTSPSSYNGRNNAAREIMSPGHRSPHLVSQLNSDMVSDDRDLDRLVRQWESAGSPAPNVNSHYPSPGQSRPLSAPRYATSFARRTETVAGATTNQEKLEDPRLDPENAEKALAVLRREELDLMEHRVTNMRLGLLDNVLKPVVAQFIENNARFLEIAKKIDKGQPNLQSLRLLEMIAQISNSQYAKREPVLSAVRERRRLERYLSVGESEAAAAAAAPGAVNSEKCLYVMQRLFELADNRLSEYAWNSGGSFNGKNWQPHLPCDAQILMYLFRRWMDDQGLGFSASCYQEHGQKKSLPRDAPLIRQTRKAPDPPYYVLDLKANGEAQTWLVKPGRDNLFHVLILFTHATHKYFGGMLRHLNLDRTFLANVLR
eukprot:g9127.t1